MNVADGTLKTLEDFTLEDTNNLRKELEGRQQAELKMKEVITFLECCLIEALSTIETIKVYMKALKDCVEDRGSTSYDRDREAKVKSPKPPIIKGVCDTQDVENLLWNLGNYFKCNRVKSDENQINTVVLYFSEMYMLW